MTLAEKTNKLLSYSVIIKSADKKTWQESLPKMSEPQVQTLYSVLVDEVKAWKKEGISIIPDPAVELQLLPTAEHGSSLDTLKARLEGKLPPQGVEAAAKKDFAAELKREVTTPELVPNPVPPKPKPTPPPAKPEAEQAPEQPEQAEEELDEIETTQKAEIPNPDKQAWMVSDQVIAPKQNIQITPRTHNLPKIRNRIAKHGLSELTSLASIDDLNKIEVAHLRQGPLPEQIRFIKQKISLLARENDLLPVNIIPVFEQSPLFQTYLKAGAKLIESNLGEEKMAFDQIAADMDAAGEDALNQDEFEAVADLKKDLESMAGI
jgi:hypothetical protein